MAKKKYVKNKNGIVTAEITTNLSLQKPLLSDNYDIGVHNGNMDIIDGEFKKVKDSLSQNQSDIDDIKGQVQGLELTAEKVTIKDSGNKFEATNVEDALLENKKSILGLEKDVTGSSERLATILTSKKLNSTANEGLKSLIEKVDLLRPAIVPGLIYDNGDECIETSGGFKVVNGTGTCTLNKLSDKMRLSCYAAGNMDNGISTVKKINVTDYSKLKFNISLEGGFKGVCIAGLSSIDGSTNINVASVNIRSGGEHELNVSSLSGEYYVMIKSVYNTHLTHTNTIDVLKIWAEV